MVLAIVLVIAVILSVVVLVVSAPLRSGAAAAARAAGRAPTHPGAEEPGEIADLSAARDAKYREIRDAELDHRTGKLSDADYHAVDQALREEAVEILRALDRAGGAEGAAAPEPPQ